MANNKKKTQDPEGIKLMTFHGSKGLEWSSVFIVDANDGVTPSRQSVTDEEVEEERRMFYVALTRAKNFAAILSSASPTPYLWQLEKERELD